MDVSKPSLWWPTGYGEQTLYELSVQLLSNGKVIDSDSRKIGFRSVRLVTEPIPHQNGSTFYIEVNQVPIFAKVNFWWE